MNRPFDLREVLFLIPAYNEEGNLGAVLDELHREFPAATLLVIDDGSADRTAAVARAHEAVVVTLPFNMGIGAAIQTGIAYALAEGFHWVLRLDGDGQHDPSDIHRFFDHIRRQPVDLLVGSRFLSRAGFQSSWLRRLAIGFPLPPDPGADGIPGDRRHVRVPPVQPPGHAAPLPLLPRRLSGARSHHHAV